MIALGLKDFFVHIKTDKTNIKCFFRELHWQLKYAWRRAWYGYDAVDGIEIGGYRY